MNFIRRIFQNHPKRNNMLRNVSNEMNLKFTDRNETGMHLQLSEFKLFDFGASRKIINQMSEYKLNAENHVFDYEYVVSTGKSSKIYNQTVFFVSSKELSLPQFHQKPENIITRILSLIGFDDIDFANFPDYSKLYYLKGEYEDVIRYYFTRDVIELLSKEKNLSVEGMNYYLILYQLDKLCPPEKVKAFRNLGLMLYNLFLLQSSNSQNMLTE